MPEPRDELSVLIDRKRFEGWDDIEVHLSLDAHATVGFVAPFEPEHREFRETFRPFSFKPIEVLVDGARLFTGTLVDVAPRTEAELRTVDVTAYSRPAVLEDTDVPVDLMPFETNGLTIKQIAERLATPFGFGVKMLAPEGAPFRRTKKSPKAEGKAQSFLAELAKQRRLVISSTEDGDLAFLQSVKTGYPVAVLDEGARPVISVTATFSPQSYYTEITGYVAAKGGRRGSKYTERHTRLAGGALRAYAFRLDDTEKGDAPGAVKAETARMFAAMAAYVVELPTWRDPNGKLWKPNTTVRLKAPGAMIYTTYEFLIRDVILRQNAGEKTASIGLVLPGAFSGEVPSFFPWEG